jgi:hypothetical protein
MKTLRKSGMVLSLFLTLAAAVTTSGQGKIERGHAFINLNAGFQGNRFQTSSWHPSVNVHADYAIFDNTTISIVGNYYGEQISKNSSFHSYSLGLRSAFYFNSLLKRDKKQINYYAGLGLMFYHLQFTGFSPIKGKIYLPIHIGAQRLISKNSGLTLELAYNDMSFIKIGLFTKVRFKNWTRR